MATIGMTNIASIGRKPTPISITFIFASQSMFRSIARKPTTLRALSSQHYHSTLRMSTKQIVPEDWEIIETSPGGIDKDFCNQKTGEATWYTPQGMTAEEILRVPGARKYWNTVADVEEYIQKMAEQKAQSGGKDIKDSESS